ncbi:MAG: hypothetical protein HYV26_03265 [Candidatus Hydrogenedentes bacterium]|nr:hypothetical protein [Candidatus Hydrogenedentota bacterium]
MMTSLAVVLHAGFVLNAVLGASPVWVDFNASSNGTGTETSPYNNLASALAGVDPGGTIKFEPGAKLVPATLITQAVRLEAAGGGAVRIGPGGHVLVTSVVGNGSVDPAAGNFAPGPLTLAALPDASPGSTWAFRRWELDLTGTLTPSDLTMDGDKTVRARFFQTDQADLLVLQATNPAATATRGDPVTVSWTVENYGGAAAQAGSGTWKDGVYLSTDALWDADDELLGEKTIGAPLASAGTYQESLAVTVPDVAPGSYYMLVKTDIESAVPEGTDRPEEHAAAAAQLLLVLDPVLNNE